MTTNRLATSNGGASDKKYDKCPIDMPRGDNEADKAARQRYWIERGNTDLAAAGKGHLHWQCLNGNYFIEERTETARRIEADRQIKDAVRALGRAAR